MSSDNTTTRPQNTRQAPRNGPHLPDRLVRSSAIRAHASYVGERIDLRRLASSERIATHPMMATVGADGVAVLFRYGVVVFFNTDRESEQAYLRDIVRLVRDPHPVPETETYTLRCAPNQEEAIESEAICLRELTVERLQLVAWVLSKSVVLAEYESRVADNFQLIEPFAVELRTRGHGRRRMKQLLNQVGNVLLTEHIMVARVEVRDKPELLWECPQLEPLYQRLEDEFEISERAAALERKLALISRTVTTLLELLQNQRSLRMEWYIVLLIVLEVLLMMYEAFWHA